MRKLTMFLAVAVVLTGSLSGIEADLTVSSSDGVKLAGTLTLPPGEGPFPAVVFTHGSEPGVRSHLGYRRWARVFEEHGFATLIFDKRGNGESEGIYVEAPDLDVPANDLIAWVTLLAGRTEIQSESIGVLGWSQGGWVGPLAASKSEKIAWVVSISGPGVSPLEQNIFDKTNQFAATGATTEQVARFSKTIRLVWTYIVTGKGEVEAQKAWDETKDKPWFKNYQGPPMMDRERLLQHPRMLDYDAHSRYEPAPVLTSLKVPMLAVFGENDRVVPVNRSIRAMKDAFDSGGNKSLLYITVIPGGDHGLRILAPNGTRQLSSDAIEDVVEWTATRNNE